MLSEDIARKAFRQMISYGEVGVPASSCNHSEISHGHVVAEDKEVPNFVRKWDDNLGRYAFIECK